MLVCPSLLVPAAAASDDYVTSTQFDIFVESLGNLLNYIWDAIVDQTNSIVNKITASNTHLNNIYWIVYDLQDYFKRLQYNILQGMNSGVNTIQTMYRNEILPLLYYYETKLLEFKNYFEILIKGEEGVADDFNNQVSTEATEFEENMEIIQDVTRPSIEDIELDVDKEIPEGEVAKVGQLLGIFFQNQYIYIVFFIAFTFSLVSYGIFGKR